MFDSAETFWTLATQNYFFEENIFNNAQVRRSDSGRNINSTFILWYNGKSLWYQNFNLKPIRKVGGSQSNVDFDAADSCCLYVTTEKAMNCQSDILSIQNDNWKKNFVLLYDSTSRQDAN